MPKRSGICANHPVSIGNMEKPEQKLGFRKIGLTTIIADATSPSIGWPNRFGTLGGWTFTRQPLADDISLVSSGFFRVVSARESVRGGMRLQAQSFEDDARGQFGVAAPADLAFQAMVQGHYGSWFVSKGRVTEWF